MKNCFAKILYKNGDYYEGFTENGKRYGQGMHYYANGDIFDGDFVNDHWVGKGSLKFHQGGEYIG